MRLGVLLLILTAIQPNWGDVQFGKVWLDPPVKVADDQALRIDIQTSNPLHHVRVIDVKACGAVDAPFWKYDPKHADRTGCNSPGFEAMEIYNEQLVKEKGSLASKFRVRTTPRSIFVRRRLVNRNTPIVYLQIKVRLTDEHGDALRQQYTGSEADWVLFSRYSVTERYVPLDTVEHAMAGPNAVGPESAKEVLSALIGLPSKEERDDDHLVPVTASSAMTPVDGQQQASTTSSLTGMDKFLIATSGAVFVGFLVFLGLYFGNKKAKRNIKALRRQGVMPDDDYGSKRATEEQSLRIRWFNSAALAGFYRGLARSSDFDKGSVDVV